MLPNVLVHSLWLLLAVIWPLLQSLHAIQEKSSDRKLWLFYWLCYITGSFLLHWFDWLLRLPFWLLGFWVDLYSEAQLALVCYLVLPRFGGIAQLRSLVIDRTAKLRRQLLGILASKLQEVFRARPQDRGID